MREEYEADRTEITDAVPGTALLLTITSYDGSKMTAHFDMVLPA
ncbi:MAG: hypothetical protein NWR45_05515 [Candidatus Nanopelagicales bacterium]|nr:hypothetical protein [Candidatus Nanopelagicales bacterium]MDP4888450.1 hypothetical protein [Candidatus Nanopelagicales bacterium]